MIAPSSEQLAQLADQGYRRVPMAVAVLADMETPLSCYLKLGAGPYSYLLESVQGGAQWGRFSIIGLSSHERIELKNGVIRHFQNGVLTDTHHSNDPLDWIRQYQANLAVATPADLPNLDLPKFSGGLVGYFAYDTVGLVESKVATTFPVDPGLDTPDILLMLSDEAAVFDNLSGRLYLITHVDPASPDA